MNLNDYVSATFRFVSEQLSSYYFDENGFVKQQTEEKLFNELSVKRDKECQTWRALLQAKPEINWSLYAKLDIITSFSDLVKSNQTLLGALQVYRIMLSEMIAIWKSKNMMGSNFAINRWTTVESAIQVLLCNAFAHCC